MLLSHVIVQKKSAAKQVNREGVLPGIAQALLQIQALGWSGLIALVWKCEGPWQGGRKKILITYYEGPATVLGKPCVS